MTESVALFSRSEATRADAHDAPVLVVDLDGPVTAGDETLDDLSMYFPRLSYCGWWS